jgi:glutathione synthase/RimK-type ligase-like ATP-grasp enzyme
MYNYRHFLFEQSTDKINWIKSKPVKSAVESPKLKELINKAMSSFFNLIHLDDDNIKIQKDKPLLVYFGSNEKGIQILKKLRIPSDICYNKTEEVKKSSNKKDFHELLGDKEYLPKTVTDRSKIKSLKFPIIAKPSKGHSGLGIFKFDTIDECTKELENNKELDVFSECIKDIDTEYRFVFVKDKLFLVHERVAIQENNKTIHTKEPDEKLSFLYVEQDLEKQDYKIQDLVSDLRKSIQLDFYALDLILDKNGKYWLLETNSGIGMGANTLSRAYSALYTDFYKKEPSTLKKELIEEICSEYYKEIKNLYPNEIKKSKNPKKYNK